MEDGDGMGLGPRSRATEDMERLFCRGESAPAWNVDTWPVSRLYWQVRYESTL